MSWKTCPSLRLIIFTGKCLKILKFRPQLLGKNNNYFFVLLNFDHLKKKLFFGLGNIRVITVVQNVLPCLHEAGPKDIIFQYCKIF